MNGSKPTIEKMEAAESAASHAPTIEQSLDDLKLHLDEMQQAGRLWIAAKADAVRAQLWRVLIFAILGVVLLVSAVTLIVTLTFFLLRGVAGAISEASGHRPWVGELATVLLVATIGFIVARVKLRRMQDARLQSKIEKYDGQSAAP